MADIAHAVIIIVDMSERTFINRLSCLTLSALYGRLFCNIAVSRQLFNVLPFVVTCLLFKCTRESEMEHFIGRTVKLEGVLYRALVAGQIISVDHL